MQAQLTLVKNLVPFVATPKAGIRKWQGASLKRLTKLCNTCPATRLKEAVAQKDRNEHQLLDASAFFNEDVTTSGS